MIKYIGTVIKESLDNPDILKTFQVVDVHATNEPNPVDRWNIFKVLVTRDQIFDIQNHIKEGKWYIDFKNNDEVFVVYKDKIFEYKVRNTKNRDLAVEYGRTLGIPEEQLDF